MLEVEDLFLLWPIFISLWYNNVDWMEVSTHYKYLHCRAPYSVAAKGKNTSAVT